LEGGIPNTEKKLQGYKKNPNTPGGVMGLFSGTAKKGKTLGRIRHSKKSPTTMQKKKGHLRD